MRLSPTRGRLSIYIPCRGKFAQSRQRRIQRWLNNPRINVHRLYKPLIQKALANWSELQTFAEYGLRFDIEENFLDDQSGGWNIQYSMIRDVCALSRLWFILAVATLYVSSQGVEVVDSGKRRWVDTHWFRGNSYFRIGWDWVKAALLNGWKLINFVVFTSNHDPHPAMASRNQYEQRLSQLEFKVQTYSYAVS